MQNEQSMPTESDDADKSIWRVEILYRDGNAKEKTNRYPIDNLDSRGLMKVRSHLYTMGLLLPIDPGHWRLIAPFDILDVHVWKVKCF